MRVIQSDVVQREPNLRVRRHPIVVCHLWIIIKRLLGVFEWEPARACFSVVFEPSACDRCTLISEEFRARAEPVVGLSLALAPMPVFVRIIAIRQPYAGDLVV